jgi:hypothetical protein
MYEITQLSSIFIPEFDIVFESSFPHMESGTFRWADLGNFNNKQEKKEALQNKCQELIEKGCLGIMWKKEGVPLHIAIGFREVENSLNFIHWSYSFLSQDRSGSKSYIYSDQYIQETKNFFEKELLLNGYKISCVKDKGVYNHHKTKSNSFYSLFEEKDLEQGFSELTFLYR